MKTVEQLAIYETGCLDGRDLNRLAQFIPTKYWEKMGLEPVEGNTLEEIDKAIKPLTEENVKAQLAGDLAFAFDKALGGRGLSAGAMHSVIKMWMWVLDDIELYDKADSMYPQYGLPFLAAVARKYNLPCPIGDDVGNEDKYAS